MQKSQISQLFVILNTYVLNKKHNHLQSMDAYRRKFLYGLWLCNQLQKHKFQDCKGVDILF